jgi:hypothetical protein
MIAKALQPGDWTTSLDLTDAYLHIPIKPVSRKFLRFAFQGKVYEWTSLPFGLATSPYVFTIVVSQIGVYVRQFSIHLHQYLDD